MWSNCELLYVQIARSGLLLFVPMVLHSLPPIVIPVYSYSIIDVTSNMTILFSTYTYIVSDNDDNNYYLYDDII